MLSSPPVAQSTSKQQTPSTSDISKLLQKVESLKKSEILGQLPSKVSELCKKNEADGGSIMSEFAKTITDKAINDPEFATVAAQFCNACWINERTGQLLRNPLLSTIQAEYKLEGKTWNYHKDIAK